MPPRRPHVTALTLTAVAFAAAACGGSGGADDGAGGGGFSDQSAEQIRDAVVTDMKALESVHLVADLTGGDQRIGLDLRLDVEGTCVGTIEVAGAEADLITADGTTYLKGDEDFWSALTSAEQGAAVADLTHGRWARMPAGEAGFEGFCNLGDLLSSFEKGAADDSDITKGEEAEVDGQPAIELITVEKDAEEPTTSWVSTSGEGHYILRIERTGDNAGTATMSDFNEPVSVTVPTGDDNVVGLG